MTLTLSLAGAIMLAALLAYVLDREPELEAEPDDDAAPAPPYDRELEWARDRERELRRCVVCDGAGCEFCPRVRLEVVR